MNPFIGQLICVGFNFAPPGWALCNGQLLPIAQYQALFAVLGTTYGGDGIRTFGLPDLRGRVAIHQGQGSGLQNYVWGQSGGTETVTLNQNQMPSHNHTIGATSNAGSVAHPNGQYLASSGGGSIYDPGTAGNHVDSKLAANAVSLAGGGQPFDNRAPYLTMTWLIATAGVFPSRQ